jgi:hypothetical protein
MNFALDQVALAQIIGALVFLAATGMLIWEAVSTISLAFCNELEGTNT